MHRTRTADGSGSGGGGWWSARTGKLVIGGGVLLATSVLLLQVAHTALPASTLTTTARVRGDGDGKEVSERSVEAAVNVCAPLVAEACAAAAQAAAVAAVASVQAAAAAAAVPSPSPAAVSTKPPRPSLTATTVIVTEAGTELLKRPPRRPPAWDWEEGCLPPRPPPHAPSATGHALWQSMDDAGFSGTNAFAQEERGRVLLGPCTCPLHGGGPYDGWSFDCGDWDWRILSDLAPWHSMTLSPQALDMAYAKNTANIPPAYHFSIHGGRVYWKMQGPTSAYHESLLDMLTTVANMVPLPDVEWVMTGCWDHPKVPRQEPIPVFGCVRSAGNNDVSFVHPYRWHGGGLDWSTPDCPPFEAREGKLLWRGSCMGPMSPFENTVWRSYIRLRPNTLTQEHPEHMNAGVVERCVEDNEQVCAASLGFV